MKYKSIILLCLVMSLVLLSGCNDYMDRKDFCIKKGYDGFVVEDENLFFNQNFYCVKYTKGELQYNDNLLICNSCCEKCD